MRVWSVGCLGLLVSWLATGVLGIVLLLVAFGVIWTLGEATLPPPLQAALGRWLAGAPPDDPAFIVVGEVAGRPLPPPPVGDARPGGPGIGLPGNAAPGCGDFLWPVAGGIITQPFIPGRHWGVDIGIPEGTPLLAPASGTVLWADRLEGGYGLAVLIGAGERRYLLAHLSRPLVAAGQPVRAGEVVGLSGNTGRSTGPHLHFEVREGSRRLDPLACRGQPQAPTGPAQGGGELLAAARVTPGRPVWALLLLGTGEGAVVRLSRPDFWVWPAGRPDLARQGGALFQETAEVHIGPRPGETWGALPLRPGLAWAVSVLAEGR